MNQIHSHNSPNANPARRPGVHDLEEELILPVRFPVWEIWGYLHTVYTYKGASEGPEYVQAGGGENKGG